MFAELSKLNTIHHTHNKIHTVHATFACTVLEPPRIIH